MEFERPLSVNIAYDPGNQIVWSLGCESDHRTYFRIAPSGRLNLRSNKEKAPLTGAEDWCRHHESNAGPTDYKSVALPTELRRPGCFSCFPIGLYSSCLASIGAANFIAFGPGWQALRRDRADAVAGPGLTGLPPSFPLAASIAVKPGKKRAMFDSKLSNSYRSDEAFASASIGARNSGSIPVSGRELVSLPKRS